MPMIIDSTDDIKITYRETHRPQTGGPRLTTVNFIRQFSRAYTALSGTPLNQMVCK